MRFNQTRAGVAEVTKQIRECLGPQTESVLSTEASSGGMIEVKLQNVFLAEADTKTQFPQPDLAERPGSVLNSTA